MVKHIKVIYNSLYIWLIIKLTSSVFKIAQEPNPSLTSIISFICGLTFSVKQSLCDIWSANGIVNDQTVELQ